MYKQEKIKRVTRPQNTPVFKKTGAVAFPWEIKKY